VSDGRNIFNTLRLLRVALALASVALLGTVGFGQQKPSGQNRPPPPQTAPTQQNFDNVEIHVLPVQRNVYMLVGAGGNVALQVGDEGVIVVDTQFAPLGDKILAAIRRISDTPIRYVINTHVHPDHTGGNEFFSRAGRTTTGAPAPIVAHENVLTRMSASPTGNQAAIPAAALPMDTYFAGTKELYLNGEAIQLMFQPKAHTDGDSFVYFRGSDVVASGDIFVMTTYPFIDQQRGGSIQGIIDALNNLLDITIPRTHQEGGTMVIPGHGRLCDEHDVLEYRDMLTIIRDRVQDMIKRGLTLAQVKAARPTLDYDPRWGADSGFWTTDMFVEAVYRDLGGKK